MNIKKIQVPEGFHDLKLGQLQEILSLNERKLERLKSLSHFISIVCKIEYEVATQMSLTDLLTIEKELLWVYKSPAAVKVKSSYKLGNLHYNAILDLSKITAGQYIDAKHVVEQGVNSMNMHKLLAVFFLPAGVKYTGEVYEQTCKDVYENLNCEDAFALQGFFLNSSQQLKEDFQFYIVEHAVQQGFKTIASSSSGDGL